MLGGSKTRVTVVRWNVWVCCTRCLEDCSVECRLYGNVGNGVTEMVIQGVDNIQGIYVIED